MTATVSQLPTAQRHDAVARQLRWLDSSHLPPHLRDVVRPLAAAANYILGAVPDSPELALALHDLVKAKDGFVRARILAGEPS